MKIMLARTKRGLWRGLTALLVLVLCVSLLLGNILEANAGTMTPPWAPSDRGSFPNMTPTIRSMTNSLPPEEFLNADGTGNSHALIEAASTWAAGR